nr:molybdopterin-dependent oxidoreductase [Deltaproteobacteria bacterium]
LETVRQLVQDFPPERVAGPTGIDAETIIALAEGLCEAESGVCYGRMGTSVQPHGALCAWLIVVLDIVTGNFDRTGGAMFTAPAVDVIDAPKGLGAGRGSFGRWRSTVRDLPEFGGELPVATMADEMLTEGPAQIRGLVTTAGNPVLSTPNGARLDEAIAGLDFYVAIDLYLNETTRHAHLILPPTSPLERSHYDLVFHVLAVRNTAKFSEPCFEPGPDQRHDWQILNGLSKRLAQLRGEYPVGERVTDALLGRVGPDRVVDIGLRTGPYGLRARGLRGLSLGQLRRQPHGVDLGPLEPCLLARLPHGKIVLAPELMVDGLNQLRDSMRDEPEPAEVSGADASLQLIGRRQLRTNNSWMHNVPALVSGKPRCTLMMHPDDAAARRLAEGDEACVTSRVGEVRVAVELTADVMPGVVSLPHGFGHARSGTRMDVASAHAGVSINDLTDEQRIDPLCGNAALSGVAVTVTAVA